MTEWNTDIEQAPYGVVLEVTNDLMDKPVLATRGYRMKDGTVHSDQTFFSSVDSPFLGPCAGSLVIPNKWRRQQD